MALKIASVFILSMLLSCVLSMTIERELADTVRDGFSHFKRSTCKNDCWGKFESCIKAGETLADHLVCLEAKDGCYQAC